MERWPFLFGFWLGQLWGNREVFGEYFQFASRPGRRKFGWELFQGFLTG